jgi:hypothetical protein
MGVLITSLELGYVTGLICADISAVANGISKLLQRLRRPGPSRRVHPR